ncbi:DUF4856 domain-containing protein [Galbibacter sp. EGI 63066]|uniref:DUF4856 domain-containing protein n=1 Tax=Galbibacter sp. EGI 63066 TaxID=2993559 RepID=UPI002249561F|nr:DUF4856 domain-containing protein [Galbibacter sp. EGI 63066]MCX2681101.1 DUF4856 domain-containing protein [Galbibacter sp. EGI 63066]
MKFRNLLMVLSVSAMVFTSCSSDDDNINENEGGYTIPASYTFERNGESSVSHGGQDTRLLMLDEVRAEIKTSENWPLEEQHLLNMYSNTDAPFDDVALNEATSKQLKSKTAASADYFVNLNGGGSTEEQLAVRADFEAWLSGAADASVNGSSETQASAGVAGIIEGGRLVGANGLEFEQLMAKGLMGACLMDQILNNYLSTAVLDEANNITNNDEDVLDEGKNHTVMEHKWDEAYGYIYGAGGGKYWDGYIDEVDADPDFAGVRAAIDEAFITGRAAIVNKDYGTRDEQVAIIRENLSLVAAVRAVYYLKSGESNLTPDVTASFHALSEAYGFILSLRFTQNPTTGEPYISKEDVDAILDDLIAGENGLWDVDHLNAILDTRSEEIATAFGFTVAGAANSAE